MATDWGSVPAWVGLAFGSTALAAYVSARRDARRAPGAAVYLVHQGFKVSSPPSDDDFTAYKVVNTGSLPVYDVGVSVWEYGRRRWFWRIRRFTRWMTSDQITGRVHVAIEPGGQGEGGDMPAPRHRSEAKRVGDSTAPPVLVVFRDGNGRQWVRWPDGRLNRVHFIRWT